MRDCAGELARFGDLRRAGEARWASAGLPLSHFKVSRPWNCRRWIGKKSTPSRRTKSSPNSAPPAAPSPPNAIHGARRNPSHSSSAKPLRSHETHKVHDSQTDPNLPTENLQGRSRFASRRIASMLVFPVAFRMPPTVASLRNSSIGRGRFLFRASLRFCCISPVLGGAWSRWRLSNPGSFIVRSFCGGEVRRLLLLVCN